MRLHSLSLFVYLLLAGSQTGQVIAAEPTSMDEQCRMLLSRWKTDFDEQGFTGTVAPPFVLAGDGSPAQLARYRDGTVLAAAAALRANYFKVEPAEPILVLLFESEGPYRRLAKKWFNDESVPHYGYFRHDNVMLMNVSTGTGTLVHELTHALIKPDFPAVPSWFNEGFASLFEQCSLSGGNIRGLVNWRLPALQKAVEADTLRTLEGLIDDPDFYRQDSVGLNYAQARYLMLYLQEKNLLKRFYTTFRDGSKAHPRGLATLKAVIAPQSLGDFEKAWRQWVMTLHFN